jgi:hypothetical protein
VRFNDGSRDGILCPQNQDDILQYEWLPFRSGDGGGVAAALPTCKAEDFALVRHPEDQ